MTIDVVVVSYNSHAHLRDCVSQVLDVGDLGVYVVDNASTDDSLASILDLPVRRIALSENIGFGGGCNVGWRAGSADLVLFLNPDARIDRDSLAALAAALDRDPQLGAVAPRIVDAAGELDYSLRRFPRTRATVAQALFVHRLFPNSAWVDETIRDRGVYERGGRMEWVSGACMLVRRSILEQTGGFDAGFFHYGEDKDLCRRIWDGGFAVGYEPAASAMHVGGASAPRAALLPELARSRLRYATKHMTRPGAAAERFGIALGALSHVVLGRGGPAYRRGHLLALLVALGFGDAGRLRGRPAAVVAAAADGQAE